MGWSNQNGPSARKRIGFLYNAQDHHLFHSLPIACALSRLGDYEVHVLSRDAEQQALARELASFYPDHRVVFDRLRGNAAWRSAGLGPRMPKLLALIANLDRLARFDALVVPERTSLHLKRLGLTRPKYIHTFHGASGHDRANDPRLARFDLLLAPSHRRLDRIAQAGRLKPDRATVVGYAKFDLVRRAASQREPLFDNDRPTVLYNPHHRTSTSSWPEMGLAVLDYFAAQTRYNLVFAPHIRLFDPPEAHQALMARYQGLDHMRIDLGSRSSADMTYTLAADIYLGDISSQVFEFLVEPRPCIFLNPRRLDWRGQADFGSWRLGVVVETLDEMERALATRNVWQPGFKAAQQAAFAAAFDSRDTPAPERAAQAIVDFLERGRVRAPWRPAWSRGEVPAIERA